MSNNIFANIGADTALSLQLQTNMRDLAGFFDKNDKIKPEHLPDSPSDLSSLLSRVEHLEQSPKGAGGSFVVTDLAYTTETMSLSLEQMFIVALTKNPKADIVRITKSTKDKFSGDAVLTETFVRIPDFEIARLDGGEPSYPYLPGVKKLAFMRVANGRRYATQIFPPKKEGIELSHYRALFFESALPNAFYSFVPSKELNGDGQYYLAGTDGTMQPEDANIKWYEGFLASPKEVLSSAAQGLSEEHQQLPTKHQELTAKLQELTENVSKLSEKQATQESKIAEALKIKTELKTELSESFVSPSKIWLSGTSGQLADDFTSSVRGAASSGLLSVLDEELQKIRAEISSLKSELEFLKNNHHNL